ncbi:MAG: S-layer homology domain-containing protein [Ruminococcaceae bacterium]|nr:S-layer homology domain-containing protein [Oscillospiraceae bacterium]
MKKLTSLCLAFLLAFSLCATALAADVPSDWARAEVSGAISAELVPADLQGKYQQAITRGEFCRLVIQLMRQTYAADCVEFFEENGGFTVSFTDTSDREILAAAQFGIVNGVGGGRFDPDSSIQRQAAATMLKRAANILDLTPTVALTFYDADQFAPWAAEGILFTSALIDPFSRFPVMGGTGNFRTINDETVAVFSPFDLYTREQAICTMMRIYDNWLMKTLDPDGYHEMFGYG